MSIYNNYHLTYIIKQPKRQSFNDILMCFELSNNLFCHNCCIVSLDHLGPLFTVSAEMYLNIIV